MVSARRWEIYPISVGRWGVIREGRGGEWRKRGWMENHSFAFTSVSLTIIPTLFNPLAWYAITQSDTHLLQHTLQTQENNNNHECDLEVVRRVFSSPEYEHLGSPTKKSQKYRAEYQVKALSDRRETQLRYDNLRKMLAAGKYPDSSSSTWTSRGCQRRGRCSRNMPSIPLTCRQSAAPLRRKARYPHSVYSIERAGRSFDIHHSVTPAASQAGRVRSGQCEAVRSAFGIPDRRDLRPLD